MRVVQNLAVLEYNLVSAELSELIKGDNYETKYILSNTLNDLLIDALTWGAFEHLFYFMEVTLLCTLREILRTPYF